MHNRKIAVIGLGYVGLTVASAFGRKQQIVGFDTDKTRIKELKKNYDRNDEVSLYDLQVAQIHFTSNPKYMEQSDFFIITVPTPVDKTKRPDFTILLEASRVVAKQLKKGDIVVFESTVYPGATEEKCIPILESTSNLICGVDFTVGYSPERINPADKVHTFQNIKKIVSASDDETLAIVASVYSSVVHAGVHAVSSIKVAEAVKVVENTQRDLNISILNEIAIILHQIGVNVTEVLAAAQTKWNFLSFYPGLVGGQCMSTNSYLLAHKAQEVGYEPELILAGRRINESMAKFITEKTIKKLMQLAVPIVKPRIGILGLSFKDNFPSCHESKVIDIIEELKHYNVDTFVHDPIVDCLLAKNKYGIDLVNWDEFVDMDAIIVAVGHKQYINSDKEQVNIRLNQCKLIMDVCGLFDQTIFSGTDIIYWRL